MSTIPTIKQLEERNVASEIVLMVWSDRMDLVALANIKGEVALHRLSWTKAWSLNPPKEHLPVKSIAWRPDGKILAIGYEFGQIILVKVENKIILHSIEVKSDISCLNWMQLKQKPCPPNEESFSNLYMKSVDLSSNFIPEPVSQQQFESTSGDENAKSNLLQEQNDLNLLLAGTVDGFVHVEIFGCFWAASLNLNSYLDRTCCVVGVHLGETFEKLFVTVKDSDNNVKLLILDSRIFTTHTNELFAVSLKHIKLHSLVSYLSNMITTITESWESILLEMDNKLSKYAKKTPEGGVTADFLDLLMFGICSDEMKEFLIHDLTKKGLEKFGQTIEMSYANIQKLVLKYLMKFGQNVTFHLAEMRGMARLKHRYEVLGLSEEVISEAILSNGAFLIKGGEMQQIINHSIINYKAFFRWLYTAIVHVLEEQVPNEIPKMTQQDLAYITEFLQNFDKIGRNSKQKGFIMERLGQYLTDTNLTIQPDMTGNEWSYFLSQNACLKENENVLKHFEQMSLIQQYKHLSATIERIFENPKKSIRDQFKLSHSFEIHKNFDKSKISQINVNRETAVFCFPYPPNHAHVLQIHSPDRDPQLRNARLHFRQDTTSSNEFYHVVDAKLYSPTILSVLLQEATPTKTTWLCQIPLVVIIEKMSEVDAAAGAIFDGGVEINCSWLVPKLFKCVDGMVGAEFAVSGCRKVGIVLAENRRKVRLYEMEGEEEEDEDAEMTNSTIKEADLSVEGMNVSDS